MYRLVTLRSPTCETVSRLSTTSTELSIRPTRKRPAMDRAASATSKRKGATAAKGKGTEAQPLSLEEQALLRQWLEYKKVVLDRVNSDTVPSSVLTELNTELADRTYLTGNTFTDADQLIYNGLRPFYAAQSLQLKEKYVNLSRWFHHVHHRSADAAASGVFCRSLLY